MKVGDLVKHYDQLYAGPGLVIDIAKGPARPARVVGGWGAASALVQYSDVTEWISAEDLEIINANR